MRCAITPIVLLLLCAPVMAQNPAPVPMAPPPVAPAAEPLFLDAIASPDHPTASGDSRAFVAVNLMLGMQSGFRTQLGFDLTDRSAFLVEAYYGGLFTKFSSGEAAGGAVRYQLRRCAPNGVDQLTFGPGVGFYSMINGDSRMIAPTLDIAWLRSFTPGGNWGWELGLSVGVAVEIGGDSGSNPGEVSPLISLFSGFRF